MSLGFASVPPDQLRLNGFEERLHRLIIITIPFAIHRYSEPMLAQEFLVVVRTILATTVRMMDAALWRCAKSYRYFQSLDRQVTFQPIAYRPADDAPGMQIQDYSKILPTFTHPNIGNFTCPFLVGSI